MHRSKRSTFRRAACGEPHAKQREALLTEHPEIKQYMRPDPMTAVIVVGVTCFQVAIAALTPRMHGIVYALTVYVIGATLNHSMFLAIHELCHNLAFRKPWKNRVLGIVANLPIAFPYSVVFRNYHLAHHRNLGDKALDTDIPTPLEAYLVSGSATCYIDHCMRKIVFMLFHVFSYALRPVIMKPELVVWDKWVVLNWLAQALFNAVIVRYWGWGALGYLVLSTFWAGSLLHPCSGHFIAEHYTTDASVETYSYYGPLNALTFNVGYHREHHCFANIPFRNLKHVRPYMPERGVHGSWLAVLCNFAFRDKYSLYCRVQA